MKYTITFLLTLIVGSMSGQTLTAEIDSIYSFKPGKLTREEQETKLPALDKFWLKVSSDTSKHLPILRFELNQNGHNPFFYFDGSALLLSLSQAIADKELAVRAISRCDLDDISQKIYVATLNRLARDGINVTAAAVKILHDDKYGFFIPQHALVFDQKYCLAYMLLPLKDNRYVDTLISLFPQVSTPSKISIITTLWFAYSCKGDDFLRYVITDKSIDKEAREYTEKIVNNKKLTKDQKEHLQTIGKENIDEIQAMSLSRFSDEAIAELEMTTRALRAEKKCR